MLAITSKKNILHILPYQFNIRYPSLLNLCVIIYSCFNTVIIDCCRYHQWKPQCKPSVDHFVYWETAATNNAYLQQIKFDCKSCIIDR